MRTAEDHKSSLRMAGYRLRSMRLDKGESQEQAARNMAIGEATLGRLENGRCAPRAVTAKRAADYYGTLPSRIWRPDEAAS